MSYRLLEGLHYVMRRKIQFKTGLQILLSRDQSYIDSHISLDENWFARFKSETTSFWIWTPLILITLSTFKTNSTVSRMLFFTYNLTNTLWTILVADIFLKISGLWSTCTFTIYTGYFCKGYRTIQGFPFSNRQSSRENNLLLSRHFILAFLHYTSFPTNISHFLYIACSYRHFSMGFCLKIISLRDFVMRWKKNWEGV